MSVTPRELRRIFAEMDGRSQGKGGATRSALEMRDEEATGPLTPASAPEAPGRLDREDARSIAGGTL